MYQSANGLVVKPPLLPFALNTIVMYSDYSWRRTCASAGLPRAYAIGFQFIVLSETWRLLQEFTGFLKGQCQVKVYH